MRNVTKLKREKMISFINKLKKVHSDDDSIIALNEIENHITEKNLELYLKNMKNKLIKC